MTDAAVLRARFDEPAPLTVGLEEEAMLLDGDTLDLAPRGAELVAAAAPGAPFKLELPAAQLEVATAPALRLGDALAELAVGRRALAAAAAERGLRVGCAGVHPFAPAEGELNPGGRYDITAARYGPIARRQLVFALQVHVCVRGAERALAVHNALRSYLPELAALAACAPYYEGRDTGLASVRPLISTLLPRQGVPPALASWEELAAGLAWAEDPAAWWWELRPHPRLGTLELRVPDAQPTLESAGAVAAAALCLVAWLAERHDAGEALAVAPTWRIAENRHAALRDGLAGELADLDTGELRPAPQRLGDLLAELDPVAGRLGCERELAAARRLVDAGGGAALMRRSGGVREATAWLADRYLDGISG